MDALLQVRFRPSRGDVREWVGFCTSVLRVFCRNAPMVVLLPYLMQQHGTAMSVSSWGA